MIRKAVILLALIYTVTLAAVWIAGYRETPPLLLRLDDQRLYVTTADGYLMIRYRVPDLYRLDLDEPAPAELTDDELAWRLAFVVRNRGILFFLHMPSTLTSSYAYGQIIHSPINGVTMISLWILALPVAVFLGFAGFATRRALRRRQRGNRNQCIHCGYDLTGLPEPRCPECGNTA